MSGCVDAGWIDETDPRYQPLELWSLSGHVVGDDDEFDVRSLTYEQGLAFTEELFGTVPDDVVPVVGARFVRINFGPGSINVEGVLPQFNLVVQCPKRDADLLASVIGESMRLKGIYVWKESGPAGIYAVDIREESRFRDGDGRPLIDEFIARIGDGAKTIEQGFISVNATTPSVRFFDFYDNWQPELIGELLAAVDAVAHQLDLDCTLQRFIAETRPHGKARTTLCFLTRYEPLTTDELNRAPYAERSTFMEVTEHLLGELGPSEFKRRRTEWRGILLEYLDDDERGLYAGLERIYRLLHDERPDDQYARAAAWLNRQVRSVDDEELPDPYGQ